MIASSEQFLAVIGLMAGTSVDGIDAALVFTDGEHLKRSGHALTLPYSSATRDAIFKALEEKNSDRAVLDRMIAEDHAKAAETLIKQSGIKAELIGFHGQTLLHQPRKKSVQAGDAVLLAKRLGIAVAYDFRSADIEAGGEGAPLAPIYHRLLIEQEGVPLPAAIANIGGITNITIWDGSVLRGFDTGPGNALMDELAREALGKDYDEGGVLGAQGMSDEDWLTGILEQEFFSSMKPKSLDRATLLEWGATLKSKNSADRMASFTALSARSLAKIVTKAQVKHLFLSGGGVHNPLLIKMLKTYLEENAKPAPQIAILAHADFIEAELMGFLAMRCRLGLAYTYPSTTGTPRPISGGKIAEPSSN